MIDGQVARGRRTPRAVILVGTLLGVAFVSTVETSAEACSLPAPGSLLLWPHSGDHDVPTNAKLVTESSFQTASASYWLRKLGPVVDAGGGELGPLGAGESAAPLAAVSADLDAGGLVPDPLVVSSVDLDAGDSGGLTTEGWDVASSVGGEAVPVVVTCVPQEPKRLCFGAAALEPNTRYAWGLTGENFSEYPHWFTTGSGEKTPAPVPALEIAVEYVRLSAGGGDCAGFKAATLRATFEEPVEPWFLFSPNDNDSTLIARVGEGNTSLTWETYDPEDCLSFKQVNWAGEVVGDETEVCVPPPPPDAGPDTLDAPLANDSDTSRSDAGPTTDGHESRTRDDGTTADRTTANEVGQPTEPDAGDLSNGGIANSGDGGCSCRLTTSSAPAAQAWLGLLHLAWVLRRRRQHQVASRRVSWT